MHRGYIKIWRKIEDSGLFQMHSTLALFMYMLMQATHKAKKVGTSMGVIELERGQFISGRHKLASALELSEQKVRTCLDNLHAMEIITSKATSKFTIYAIVNYNEYQTNEETITNEATSNQPAEQPTDNQQITNKQPTDNQQITTKQELKHLSIKELKKETKPSAAFALPDWIDADQWGLWLKTRPGKKMIPEQMQAQINKLSKWRDSGLDYAKALSDAAAGGWRGLVDPKQPILRGTESSNDQIRERARQRLFGGVENETI